MPGVALLTKSACPLSKAKEEVTCVELLAEANITTAHAKAPLPKACLYEVSFQSSSFISLASLLVGQVKRFKRLPRPGSNFALPTHELNRLVPQSKCGWSGIPNQPKTR